MHIAILKLFHFYLFNFSYKSDMLILCHSHVTAVFVNNDVQCRRQDTQDVIDDAIDQWRVRLRACVKAKGRHFEYLL